MKPLDPRLMKYAKAARFYIIFISALGFVTTALILAQVIFISWAVSPIIEGKKTFNETKVWFFALIVVVLLRAALFYLRERFAHRASTKTVATLRDKVLDHASKLGPRWQAHKGSDTVTLVTRGLNDLGPYFVNYLPQLILSVTVTPLTLLVMLIMDFWSAVVALITLPLIVIFMILIGKMTQEFSNKRLATMQQLGRQLLDLIAGLTTLKSLGREKGPANHIQKIGKSYTANTMATLRLAFMSGAVLEFVATLSVALVAVEVGMRLVYGNMVLVSGLIVIMLAPEVFDPIREVGKQFHASADGVAAANKAFEILETPLPEAGSKVAPNLAENTIKIESMSVAARGAWAPGNLNAEIKPGLITALVGPSGNGKTTTVMCLLGQLKPEKGRILVGDTDLKDIEEQSWFDQITWVPQHPAIVPGTIAENLGIEDVESEKLREAASACGFLSVVEEQPQGWHTPIGQGGVGLSVGQRQRLALTRALLDDVQLVILDEPTAHLDARAQQQVIDAVHMLKKQGKTVLVIAHREALKREADQIIEVPTEVFTPEEAAEYEGNEFVGATTRLAQIPRLLEDWKGEDE